jgi:hypothetical protein
MGLCYPTFKPRYDIPGESFNVMPMAIELGYSRNDVMKMHKFFTSCDIDRSGKVSIKGTQVVATSDACVFRTDRYTSVASQFRCA